MLRTEVSRSQDVSFLESVRDLSGESSAPRRTAGDRAACCCRSRRARSDDVPLAARVVPGASWRGRSGSTVIDKLKRPTGNLECRRVGLSSTGALGCSIARSIFTSRTVARAAVSNRRSLTLQLARRQGDAGNWWKAKRRCGRSTMRTARTPKSSRGSLRPRCAAKQTQRACDALPGSVQRSPRRRTEHRSGTLAGGRASIRNDSYLGALGKYQDAVDQHIEIVNSFQKSRAAGRSDRLCRAAQLDRPAGRVLREAEKEAFKNYRWKLRGRI